MSDDLFTENEMTFLKQDSKSDSPKKVAFKPYSIGENLLFPPTTDDYIGKFHIARLISLLVDRMDMSFILGTYKGGGSSSYNPRMMLKVWLLGFVYRIYTSRKLEQALEENLPFIWISGGQTPDFRTLNNFRIRLKGEIKAIFKQVVQYGMQLEIISGKDVFVDHTKLEADANRHKIIWRKNVERQLHKIDEELDELFKHIDKMNINEDAKYGDSSITDTNAASFDSEKIDMLVEGLNEKIKKKRREGKDTEKLKDDKNKLKRTKVLHNRKKDYKQKEHILGKRNSYSKTDPGATAMMQKDKVSIKPGYNEGIAVENGFVLNYEISDKSSDGQTFIDTLSGAMENIGKKIQNVHADGAYGNEENSEYLEKEGINNYLKFNTYRRENSKKWWREKVRKESMSYCKHGDYYICPDGIKLLLKEVKKELTKTGFMHTVRKYLAKENKCTKCEFYNYCTDSDRRSIQVNENYERHKESMRNNLASEKGQELRKRRGYEVETPFGDRKYNNKFGRFVLRGKDKVPIESGLYYMGHNIKKMHKYMMKNWYNPLYSSKMMQLYET